MVVSPASGREESTELQALTHALWLREDPLPGVAAAKAAKMRVAAIPDIRFVNRRKYEKRADYVLGSLKELPALVRKLTGAK